MSFANHCRFLTFSLLPILAAPAWTQAHFEVLATPPNIDRSHARAISGDGLVVVGDWVDFLPGGGFELGYCRWVASGTSPANYVFEDLNLSNLDRLVGANWDGSVIIGNGPDFFGQPRNGFLWSETGGVNLIPALSTVYSSMTVTGISDDGTVVVGVATDPNDPFSTQQAFRWTAATGTVGLGFLPGASLSEATAVSGDGQVVFGDSGLESFRWSVSTGVMEVLVSESAPPAACNGDGSIVLLDKFNDPHVLSNTGGYAPMDGPPLGFSPGGYRLEDMDQLGWTVVGRVAHSGANFDAFRWTGQAGWSLVRDDLIQNGQAAVTPYRLWIATGISHDGTVMVGDASELTTSEEVAYVAVLPLPEMGLKYCSPVNPNSTGLPGLLNGAGSVVAGHNAVQMNLAQLPIGQFGLLINGTATGLTPLAGGSQGTLCLGGAFGRYNAEVFMVDPMGQASVTLDLTQTPTPFGFVSIMAGETWYFQAWHRDQDNGPTSNFTEALGVTFF